MRYWAYSQPGGRVSRWRWVSYIGTVAFFCLLSVALWCYMIGFLEVWSFALGNRHRYFKLIVSHAGSLIICASVGIYSAVLAQTSLSKQLSCLAA